METLRAQLDGLQKENQKLRAKNARLEEITKELERENKRVVMTMQQANRTLMSRLQRKQQADQVKPKEKPPNRQRRGVDFRICNGSTYGASSLSK